MKPLAKRPIFADQETSLQIANESATATIKNIMERLIRVLIDLFIDFLFDSGYGFGKNSVFGLFGLGENCRFPGCFLHGGGENGVNGRPGFFHIYGELFA